MYHSHWGLRQSPYPDRPDPSSFFESPIHVEALARLHFLVDERRRLGLLLGGGGTGKSLLCQKFAREMRHTGKPVALVDAAGLGAREFLWDIAAQWGLNPSRHDRPFDLWRRLTDRLCEYRLQEQSCLVLVDNADESNEEVRQHILRFSLCDPSPESRLTMVVALCPDQVLTLGERVLEIAALKIDLQPWEEAETVEYLETTLRRAGCRTAPFDQGAMIRLHQLSQGVPRRVSQLAELALLAGAGDNIQQIDAATVDTVYQELGVI